MNQEEVWKKFEDYPEYEISNRGNVRNIKFGRIIKCYMERKGYLRVNLCREDQKKRISVHNLVAKYFIDNPNGYTKVGHIDRDLRNNNVENLRWETKSQNSMKQRKRQGEATSIYKGVSLRRIDSKWIAQIKIDIKHKYLGSFESQIEGAKAYDEAAKKYLESLRDLILKMMENIMNIIEMIINVKNIKHQFTDVFHFIRNFKNGKHIFELTKSKNIQGYLRQKQKRLKLMTKRQKKYMGSTKLNFKDEEEELTEQLANLNINEDKQE